MTDYQTPCYKSSEVARAAGISHVTFRSYFRRGYFRVLGDAQKANTNGLPNLFSLREAIGFAVAARLIDAGVHPKSAWQVGAVQVAHTGDSARLPGRLFDLRERGETLVVYWPDTDEGKVIAADDVKSIYDLGLGATEGRQEAAIVVSLNTVEKRVFLALGVEHRPPASN